MGSNSSCVACYAATTGVSPLRIFFSTRWKSFNYKSRATPRIKIVYCKAAQACNIILHTFVGYYLYPLHVNSGVLFFSQLVQSQPQAGTASAKSRKKYTQYRIFKIRF
jgi:hypothetical protein